VNDIALAVRDRLGLHSHPSGILAAPSQAEPKKLVATQESHLTGAMFPLTRRIRWPASRPATPIATAVILKIYETGAHPGLDAMREAVPEGVLQMLRIPGLKADRIRKLHTDLGIASVAAFEDAARSGRLRATPPRRSRGATRGGPGSPRQGTSAAAVSWCEIWLSWPSIRIAAAMRP